MLVLHTAGAGWLEELGQSPALDLLAELQKQPSGEVKISRGRSIAEEV